MTNDPGHVQVRAREDRYQCRTCKQWGRRSQDTRRSDFRHRGALKDGTGQKFESECRECGNATRRHQYLAKRDGTLTRAFTTNRDVTDDYGTIHEVRRCCDCRRWLPRTLALYEPTSQRSFTVRCRTCKAADEAAYYAATAPARRAAQRRWYREHGSDLAAMRRAEKAAAEGRAIRSAFDRRVTTRMDDRTVPVEPILAWIERRARIREGGLFQLGADLGIDDRVFRRLRKQPRVGVALVDRMLLLTDTNIRDLYPTEEVARA